MRINEHLEKILAEMVVVEPEGTTVSSEINRCKKLKLCDPVPEFEMIEKCRLCGRFL
jgi:hypothetical protein